VNDKVAEVFIMICNDNRTDLDWILKMVYKYSNLHSLQIVDYLDHVDDKVHDLLKSLLKARVILELSI